MISFKKKKLITQDLRVKPICNSTGNYSVPLYRNEDWRLKRLKIMRKHEKHSNYGGIAVLLLLIVFSGIVLATPTTTLSGCGTGWNTTDKTITLNCLGNSVILDQNQSIADTNTVVGTGITSYAGQFTPTTNNINLITLQKVGSSSSDVIISIQTDNGGNYSSGSNAPTGKKLCSNTILVATWNSYSDLTDYNFSCSADLNAATHYWFVIEGIWNNTGTRYKASGTFAGQSKFYKGGWVGLPDRGHIYFKEYNLNIACLSTDYRIDSNGEFTNYTTSFILSTDGNHKIDYNSTDLTGTETTKTSYCSIDTTSFDGNGPTFGTGINTYLYTHGTTYRFYISGTGTISSAKVTTRPNIDLNTSSCKYKGGRSFSWEAATWNTDHCEKNVTITKANETYAPDFSIDNNVGRTINDNASTPEYYYDLDKPTLTYTGCTTSWHTTNQSFALTATETITDHNSGVMATTYSIDGGTYLPYTGLVTITTDGNHKIDYNTIDYVKNENAQTTYCPISTTKPTLSYSIDKNYGFDRDTNIPFTLTCTTSSESNLTYDVNLGTTNVFHRINANGTVDNNWFLTTIGNPSITFSCLDAAGNSTTETVQPYYDINFILVNEANGTPLTASNIDKNFTIAKVYSIDGTYTYNFKDANKPYVNAVIPGIPIQFEFSYPDTTVGSTTTTYPPLSRYIDLSLISDTNLRLCVPFAQQFYQQRFVSNQERQVYLQNYVANCYDLIGRLSYAYDVGYAQTLYTINKPYYLYFYSGGVKTFLVLLDGSQANQYNLDTIIFSQQPFTLNIGLEGLSFSPLLSDGTHYNTKTIQIYYKNYYETNTKLIMDIYSDGNILVWSHTETDSPNELLTNFYWGDINAVSVDSNMFIILTKTTALGITSTTTWFNLWGDSIDAPVSEKASTGKLHIFAAIASLLIFFFGLTIVASGRIFGFFGIILCIISIIICAFALQVWYIQLLEAAYLVVIFLIVILGKQGSAYGLVG